MGNCYSKDIEIVEKVKYVYIDNYIIIDVNQPENMFIIEYIKQLYPCDNINCPCGKK